ncbi:MAG: hypothetical protein H0Z32_15195 [Bacillaceae bacterium]|nr:hypothetical protein [Bacillaceae bacterium]
MSHKNTQPIQIKELLQALYKKGNEKDQTSQSFIEQIIPMLKPLVEKNKE